MRAPANKSKPYGRDARALNPIDIHIGKRIRQRRLLLDMSLGILGEALGVSYQQVAKYEVGINRVSAAHLPLLADALGVPISFFFQTRPERDSPMPPQPVPSDLMERSETLRLARIYYTIRGKNVRAHALTILEAIAEASAPFPEVPARKARGRSS
jgi:transcriptional regulator with XRE-family HTH domain